MNRCETPGTGSKCTANTYPAQRFLPTGARVAAGGAACGFLLDRDWVRYTAPKCLPDAWYRHWMRDAVCEITRTQP